MIENVVLVYLIVIKIDLECSIIDVVLYYNLLTEMFLGVYIKIFLFIVMSYIQNEAFLFLYLGTTDRETNIHI